MSTTLEPGGGETKPTSSSTPSSERDAVGGSTASEPSPQPERATDNRTSNANRKPSRRSSAAQSDKPGPKPGPKPASKPASKTAAKSTRTRRLTRVEETSAGGLVLRLDGGQIEAALIGRLDRRKRLVWSMPKGHLEEGETAEQAAVREAQEETGIYSRVIAPLGVIDFWFVAEGRRIHKTVHHFVLEATGGDLSDEDIEVEEVAWVPVAELPTRLGYADERRLLERVPGLLADAGFHVDVRALKPGLSDADEGHAGADSA